MEEVQEDFPPGAPPLLFKSFVDGLVVVPVRDTPHTMHLLKENDAAELGVTVSELYELGAANLERSWQPLELEAEPVEYGRLGDLDTGHYQPSRLLFIDSWAPIAEAQDGVLIVAVPAGDTVLYVSDDSPACIRALRKTVERIMDESPRPLSNVLQRWTPKGWEVVPYDRLN